VFGNAGRNILRGPGLKYLDLSVSRNFVITERMKLQFRAEAFNLTNTATFGLPNENVSGGAPGVITSLAADPRILQFALRLAFWPVENRAIVRSVDDVPFSRATTWRKKDLSTPLACGRLPKGPPPASR
jgi:hypothetical protein